MKPLYVATALSNMSQAATWWAPHPDHYAQSAVATIGIQNDTFGCLSHYFQVTLISLLFVIIGLSFLSLFQDIVIQNFFGKFIAMFAFRKKLLPPSANKDTQ